MSFYCPAHISNSTWVKCIGDIPVFNTSVFHGRTGWALLIGLFLIVIYGIFILPHLFRDKEKKK